MTDADYRGTNTGICLSLILIITLIDLNYLSQLLLIPNSLLPVLKKRLLGWLLISEATLLLRTLPPGSGNENVVIC